MSATEESAVILFDIYHRAPGATEDEVLRVATRPYVTATTDTPAATAYDDRVMEGGSIERHMFGPGRTFGRGEMAVGHLVLSNTDGELDGLRTHAFDLKQVVIRRAPTRDTPLAEAPRLTTLVIEDKEISWGRLTLVLRDPMLQLDIPAITATFGGSNLGSPHGWEGDPGTIQGKLKPFVEGVARVAGPPMVNSSSLIFMSRFGPDGSPAPVDEISNVRLDYNSAAVTLDTTVGISGDAATVEELAAATIASGKYATCLAQGGALRFNSLTPNNIVTCDVKAYGGSNDRTMAQCCARIIKERAGKADSDLIGLAALDALQGNEFGIYVDSEKTVAECAWELLEGGGGWLVGDSLGRFEFGRLNNPDEGTVARVFEQDEIQDISEGGLEVVPGADPGMGNLPAWKVVTRAQRHYRVFSETQLAGAVSAADREEALQEFRRVSDEDPDVLALHAGASLLNLTSLMDDLAAVATETTRQLILRSTARAHWRLRIKETSLLPLGSVIQINTSRFDFSQGRKYMVLGYRFAFFEETIDYLIWG